MALRDQDASEAARAANAQGVQLLLARQDRLAARCFLRALALAPGWDVARFHLAQALLADGALELGWLHYEARRTIPPLPEPVAPLPFPEWRGERLEGRRIIVVGEQGHGDQIMFARYLEPLSRLDAEVLFVCNPPVAPLFPGAVSGFSRRTDADFWVHLCSLPLRLGGPIPPPARISVPTAGGGGVGVVPDGSRLLANDENRSLRGADAERLLALGRDLRPEATGARDFLDTASIIAGLDVVISVDTAIAHLAASMGKPTLVLLPAVGVDWRWPRSGAESAWYPSVTLYRQQTPGDWSAVLEQVSADAAATLSGHLVAHTLA